MRISIFASLAVLMASPAAAQGLIEPEWSVERDEGSCKVVAALPEGGTLNRITIAMPFDRRALDSIVFYVSEGATSAPANAMLGINGNPPLQSDLKWASYGEAPHAYLEVGDREELGDALLSGTPGVLRVGGEVFSLQTLTPALRQGRECVRKIFAEAGIDFDDYPGVRDLSVESGKEVRRIARSGGRLRHRVKDTTIGLFNSDDYPAEALRKKEEGTVRAALMIDEEGKVEDCVVLASAGEVLDETTCKILKSRARFTPAIDEESNTTKSIFVTPPIRWSLPFRKY